MTKVEQEKERERRKTILDSTVGRSVWLVPGGSPDQYQTLFTKRESWGLMSSNSFFFLNAYTCYTTYYICS